MRSLGICAKTISPAALDAARSTAASLRSRGLEILLEHETAAALGSDAPSFTKPDLATKSDILVTFGGDGTLLSLARHARSGVPIIGVNMGTLGFLTEIRYEEFEPVLDQVLSGYFRAEERDTFDVKVNDGQAPERTYRVLNDAVINKSALARIIQMRVNVDGAFVTNFRADGLIVATPTGSTAYNLSAGGPIIYPTMSSVVLTPICPHMLSNRPLVLPGTLTIDIEIMSEHQEVFLTLDGQEGFPLNEHQRVTIRKSAESVLLVQSPVKSYFDVLRKKLKWGEENSNQ
jgi:NAD+ kinase